MVSAGQPLLCGSFCHQLFLIITLETCYMIVYRSTKLLLIRTPFIQNINVLRLLESVRITPKMNLARILAFILCSAANISSVLDRVCFRCICHSLTLVMFLQDEDKISLWICSYTVSTIYKVNLAYIWVISCVAILAIQNYRLHLWAWLFLFSHSVACMKSVMEILYLHH